MMPDGGHLAGKEYRASIEKSIGAFSIAISMAKTSYKYLYNTKRWYRLRWHQLNDHPLCAMCQAVGRVTEATVADHITPHRGDEALFYDEENLQSLCKSCHDGAKQQLEKSGTLRGCDVNGLPLDANHHWRTPRS